MEYMTSTCLSNTTCFLCFGIQQRVFLCTGLCSQHFCWQQKWCFANPAICNLFYHATEMHVENGHWQQDKCWHFAPTANRRGASDLVPSISSTEVTTWAHRCRVKLDTSSAWQQTRSQQFSCGTSQPTPLEATFSRRLPTQPVGNKVSFGTTTRLCQFNRWQDPNMDGIMLSSTVWSTPEFRLSTRWHLKFNNMWAWSWKISTHCNQASNILTS